MQCEVCHQPATVFVCEPPNFKETCTECWSHHYSVVVHQHNNNKWFVMPENDEPNIPCYGPFSSRETARLFLQAYNLAEAERDRDNELSDEGY